MSIDPGAERLRRAGELFDELVELTGDERAARLAARDPELAREVRSLLVADERAGGFLSTPLDTAEPTLVGEALAGGAGAKAALAAGERIGAWRLVRPLGAGGMGEVWEVARADG